MRITIKVAGAGSNGMTRMPYLDMDIEKSLTKSDGTLDEGKVRALYRDLDGVQIGSDDGLPVLAVATELLSQVGKACKRMVAERRTTDTSQVHDAAECADDRHAERNMRKGRWVYVRMDIWRSRPENCMKVRVDVQNPKGVVGITEKIAREYAVILARIMANMADQLRENHDELRFDLTGGEGFPDVFEEARKADRVAEMRYRRDHCERRTSGGFCSPCDFACPMCRGGRCEEIEA